MKHIPPFILGASLLVPLAVLHAAEPRPNILFAVADDMGLNIGVYGTEWVRTPNMDRLAQQGLLFMNAYTPCAKCSPSRACILTGRNPWQNEQAANHEAIYPVKLKSWMEALGDAGYSIGFTGKGWAPGRLPPERKNITGKDWQEKKLKPSTSGISPIDYAANFQDFLADAPKDKPFCFWYGGHEPHRPYEYGSGVSKGGYQLSQIDGVPSYWPGDKEVHNDMLDYAFEVAYFDAQLGKMIALLKEKGLLDNTLIVVTSDNGPSFPRMKGHPYEQSCHLPLVVMWPKGIVAPGRKSEAFVSFIDFAPTFLESAGVNTDNSGMQSITGQSFTDILANRKSTFDRSVLLMGRERNDPNARPGTPSGLGYPVRALRFNNLFYLHNFEPDRWPCGNPELGLKDTDNSPTKKAVMAEDTNSQNWQLCFGKRPVDELYDLSADPDCVNNLAEKIESRAKVAALREQLFDRLKQQNDPRLLDHGGVFDNYPSARENKTKSNHE